MKTPFPVVISGALAVALAGTLVAIAGPLVPPAGAVAPTHKTLTEVEPRIAINAANTPGDADSSFKITQPGSYYLTANITGSPAKHGIEIDASGVTLDLNGFHLVGDPTTLAGIKINNIALVGVTITNGTVRAWGQAGVDLTAIGTSGFHLEGITALQNGLDGIVAGTFGSITNCHAFANGSHGFRGAPGSSISHCTARQNAGTGFNLGNAVAVSHCVASQNEAIGFFTGTASSLDHCTAQSNGGEGFFIGSSSSISGCLAQSNLLDGIRASTACLITRNQCHNNASTAADGAGIHVTGSDNRLEDNNVIASDRGIDADAPGNIILRNTCSGNTIAFVLAANNYYGSIVDRAGIVTPVVNGPAAPGTLTSTDPHANFSY